MQTTALWSLLTILLWATNPILARIGSEMIGIKPYIITSSIFQITATIVIINLLDHNIWRDIYMALLTNNPTIPQTPPLNTLMATPTPQSSPSLTKKWLVVAIDGIFCLACPFIIYNFLLMSANNIAIIVTTTWYGAPILTAIASTFILNQHLTGLQIGGIIISILGIILLNIEDILGFKDPEKNNEEELRNLLK